MGHHHHDHNHHNHEHHHDHGTGNIAVAFWLNLFFTIVEIIGGILTNSVAILSDALHDFGDSLSLALAWYFQKIAQKKRDSNFSYGYKRFSLLSAVINSIVLLLGSVIILYTTIPRLFNPQKVHAEGMIYLAIAGVAINGLAVLRLRKGTSLNERVVSLHLLEDVLGWVAVLIGSIIMYFFDIPVIDPILSVIITIYILYNVIKNLRNGFSVFMQAIPKNISETEIIEKIKQIPEIKELHDIHLWSVDGEYHIFTLHVVISENCSANEIICIKENVRKIVDDFNIQHATIEIEFGNEKCKLENC